MEPLTREDGEHSWRGHFVPIEGQWGFDFGWALEFEKMRARKGLLEHLESLPWPRPETLQVLLRDQDDDVFGLWMFQDGKLVETPSPAPSASTTRHRPPTSSNPTRACCCARTPAGSYPTRLRRNCVIRDRLGRAVVRSSIPAVSADAECASGWGG
ncbi:hypothetical protein ACU686_34490 [Yinghuangia aomiensis]